MKYLLRVSKIIGAIILSSNSIFGKGELYLEFTKYDFQIVENYITLSNKLIYTVTKENCPIAELNDAVLHVKLYVTSNCKGWKAIRVIDNHDTKIEYFINYELKKEGNSLVEESVTILTSHGGAENDKRASQHFLKTLTEIKKQLLVRDNLNLIYHFLSTGLGNEGIKHISSGNDLKFIIEKVSHNERYFTIISLGTVKESHASYSYVIREKMTRRKSKISWHYNTHLEEDLPDEIFFKHFTDLLLASKGNRK